MWSKHFTKSIFDRLETRVTVYHLINSFRLANSEVQMLLVSLNFQV